MIAKPATGCVTAALLMTLGGACAGPAKDVVVHPSLYDKAFRNPLTGFRPDIGGKHPYATLFRHYIRWNTIENAEADGIDKIRAYCDAAWKDLPSRNGKVIPRVYLDWPGRPGSWPADLTEGDYTSDAFRARLVRLIERLGQLWDNDPRVAFIETGLIGRWGEQHTPKPPPDLQALMGDAFTRAFPHKLLENRYPTAFEAYRWGIYWDSFGCDQNAAMKRLSDRWKTVPYEGEIAYDYCVPAGKKPIEDVTIPANTTKILDLVRDFHITGLGWIASARYDTTTAVGIDTLQKAFGYRFVISEATYPSRAQPGGALTLKMSVRNLGSAPFYYRWPLEVSLLDLKTRQPVWKGIFENVDLRTWLPGDRWDPATGSYLDPPVPSVAAGVFQLPAALPRATYIVAIAVLDPAGMAPSLRFASGNYFRGGRHPLGLIGVGTKPPTTTISPTDFDDLQADVTIGYSP